MNCKHPIQTLASLSFIDQKDNNLVGEDNIAVTIDETPEHNAKVKIQEVEDKETKDDSIEAIEKEDNFEEDPENNDLPLDNDIEVQNRPNVFSSTRVFK